MSGPEKAAKHLATWTRERRIPRGAAPTVERIVDAAIAVADGESLEAVSLRRVASDLGSGTTSLYRCIASRDELLDLMVDAALGEGDQPDATGRWRIDLSAFARRLRLLLRRHPWLGAQLIGRPALGPNSISQYEFALASAAALTSDATLATNVVHTVVAYVLGASAGEVAEVQAQHRSGLTEGQWQAQVGPYVRERIDDGQSPHFARWVLESEDIDHDLRFEFGLECVLRGLSASIES